MALIHIFAGLLAITAGAFALSAAKGGTLHRKAGTIFVYSMLFMAGAAAVMAGLKFHMDLHKGNVVAATLTIYLVLTAFLTVRPRGRFSRAIDIGAILIALPLGLICWIWAIQLLTGPKPSWFPAAPLSVLGTIAIVAALGDVRMVAAGGLKGTRRIARHLWRMCFGLFIAAGSFFLGQAKVFPESLRIFPLLAVPVILVLLALAYWMGRVRFMKRMPKGWKEASA